VHDADLNGGKERDLVTFPGLEQSSFYAKLGLPVKGRVATVGYHYLHGYRNEYEFNNSGLEFHRCRYTLDDYHFRQKFSRMYVGVCVCVCVYVCMHACMCVCLELKTGSLAIH
jgi:hypothetical protein